MVKHGRKNFGDDVIEGAVRFILRADNFQRMSWGTRCVRCNGKYIRFPAIMKKMTSQSFWRKYNEDHQIPENVKPIGRTLFMYLVSLITKAEIRERACVDYMLSTLLYENVEVLRLLVKGVHIGEHRDRFLTQLDGLEEFMKYSYATHISINGDDEEACHNVKFGLYGGTGGGKMEGKQVKCKQCIAPFALVNDIADHIENLNNNRIEALDE